MAALIESPYLFVIPGSLLLGLVSGFAMHRSDFCIAGMFRDFFLFRQTVMLRMLALLVVVSMVLFELGRVSGWLPVYPFPILAPPSLINLFGGVAFGVGMVLAGGCVVGTLYKMGAGSILSFIAFAGLLSGAALYAEVYPWWAAVGTALTLTSGAVTLPQILGVSPGMLMPAVAGVGALGVYLWSRGEGWRRRSGPEAYVQPWKAALLLALVGFASYLIVGMPLGITTAYSKVGGFLGGLVFPGHVESLAYFQGAPFSYTPPFQDSAVTGGAGPRLDAIAAIQYPLIVGIVFGAMLSAVLLREFKVHLRVPLRQCVIAFAGGLVMGFAARMTPGCNVWHLLGGLPILAAQSLLFLLGLFPGAWLGTRLLRQVVLR